MRAAAPADARAPAGSLAPIDALTPADDARAPVGSLAPIDSLTPTDARAPAGSLAPAGSSCTAELDLAPPFPLLRPRRAEDAWTHCGLLAKRSRLGPAVLGTLVATVLGGSLCLLCGVAGALLGQRTPPEGRAGEGGEAGPRAMRAPAPGEAHPVERP
jgi:hypothetical protein